MHLIVMSDKHASLIACTFSINCQILIHTGMQSVTNLLTRSGQGEGREGDVGQSQRILLGLAVLSELAMGPMALIAMAYHEM